MKKLSFTLTLLFLSVTLSTHAFASLDYSIAGFYRTKPVSGGVNVDIGWSQLIWGDASSKPLYGFVRPSVSYFSAGTYNAHKYRFEFYPISFLGFEYGGESIHNNGIYQDFDCETFQCQSKFQNTFYKIKAVIGYGPFFAKYTNGKEELESKNPEKDFIYPVIGSALSKDGDEIKSREIFFGAKVDGFSIILQGKKSKILRRKNIHRIKALTLSTGEHQKYYLSIGKFDSHEVRDANYIAGLIVLEFGETLKLD